MKGMIALVAAIRLGVAAEAAAESLIPTELVYTRIYI